MSQWVIGLIYRLKAHKKQALMDSKPHGRPSLFNEGYLGPFDGLRVDIKAQLLALTIT